MTEPRDEVAEEGDAAEEPQLPKETIEDLDASPGQAQRVKGGETTADNRGCENATA